MRRKPKTYLAGSVFNQPGQLTRENALLQQPTQTEIALAMQNFGLVSKDPTGARNVETPMRVRLGLSRRAVLHLLNQVSRHPRSRHLMARREADAYRRLANNNTPPNQIAAEFNLTLVSFEVLVADWEKQIISEAIQFKLYAPNQPMRSEVEADTKSERELIEQVQTAEMDFAFAKPDSDEEEVHEGVRRGIQVINGPV